MKITDKELLEAYAAALKLSLDMEFIKLLEEEIEKRNLKSLVENYTEKGTLDYLGKVRYR